MAFVYQTPTASTPYNSPALSSLNFQPPPVVETPEQNLILNCQDPKITINALAGTGKTTTLLLYAKKYSDQNMLYLAYNRSIVAHARDIFPSNVTPKTFHSLAYGYVGHQYKEKMQQTLANKEVIQILELEKSTRANLLSQVILNTLNQFCSSAQSQIGIEHVDTDLLKGANVFAGKTEEEEEKIIKSVSRLTEKLWHKIIDVTTPHSINPDVYLKLFTLNPPQIKNMNRKPLHTILIDEAQDLTPCFIDFIQKQNIQTIFVGDKHQAIYGWRGAVNYLDHIGTQCTQLYLTQSFRFGSELADFSNCALTYLETDTHLKGLVGESTSIVPYDQTPPPHPKNAASKAFIARHNFSIYEELIRCLQSNTAVYVEGGLNYKELKDLKDLHDFKNTRRTHNILYEGYGSYEEMEKQINEGSITNIEITKKVMILNKWGTRFQKNFDSLMSYLTTQKERKSTPQSLILTSVHQSKGKEYDSVTLADDFLCHINFENKENMELLKQNVNNNITPIEITYKDQTKKTEFAFSKIEHHSYVEEMNIFYVAMTRARKKLHLPSSYFAVLKSLTHLLKKGEDDDFKKQCFQDKLYISEGLISLFEKEKLRLSLSTKVPSVSKNKNKI